MGHRRLRFSLFGSVFFTSHISTTFFPWGGPGGAAPASFHPSLRRALACRCASEAVGKASELVCKPHSPLSRDQHQDQDLLLESCVRGSQTHRWAPVCGGWEARTAVGGTSRRASLCPRLCGNGRKHAPSLLAVERGILFTSLDWV